MDTPLTEQPVLTDDQLAETPEDVAILYSWANLHGAKYRDFSASRREYRAQVRHRAAEDLREAELEAKAQAEAAAAEAERAARDAERAAAAPGSDNSGIDRDRALRYAEDAARRAAAERVEAARRAESAALAEAVARREEREIAEAHASAQRQAARYQEHESRRRSAAGPQPRPAGLQSDPYEFAQGASVEGDLYTPNRQLEYTQPARYQDDFVARDRTPYASGERPAYVSGERRAYAAGERRAVSGERRAFRPVEAEFRRRPQGYRPDEASGIHPVYRAPERAVDRLPDSVGPGSFSNRGIEDPRRFAQSSFADERAPQQRQPPPQPDYFTSEVTRSSPDQRPRPDLIERPQAAQDLTFADRQDYDSREQRLASPERDAGTPAWLHAADNTAQSPAPTQSAPVADTLQSSRERLASRWFAMKGVIDPGGDAASELPEVRQQETRTPVLAVFSLAGGVGKTSMIATLGRALSAAGEKVLLADTTSHGLLPYYFGASELRPGVVRTFSPPNGSTDAPIYLVSYDVDQKTPAGSFAQELVASANGTGRILLDLNASTGWIIRQLSGTLPTVLVPVAPDMNSVISLQAVEKYFAGATDSDGRPLQPFYVINQFDASLPLHLDVREVLRRQLGDRLLPIAIRRAPAVSEALAEGMTVVDYAPESGVAEDYMNIAGWLRSTAAPASQALRNGRWSER